MTYTTYPLLDNINSPTDVRNLEKDQLKQLCKEVREFLTKSVSVSGGHFSAGLGTVELTVALHYVFDTPSDKLVWDVGHQAYPHKILTGRKNRMTTIRAKDGVSAFPNRDESEYDAFGVGHSRWVQPVAGGNTASRRSSVWTPLASRRRHRCCSSISVSRRRMWLIQCKLY